MCITQIQAFAFEGKTYVREIDAITAAIAKRIGNNEAIARNVIDSATDLIPLLERAVAIKEPAKMTLAELNAEGHSSGCHARATGLADRCNCEVLTKQAGLS